MTAAIIGCSLLALAAAIWWLDRAAARRLQDHFDSALALANARSIHPTARGRCSCGDITLDGGGAVRWARTPLSEPLLHTADRCQPQREAL